MAIKPYLQLVRLPNVFTAAAGRTRSQIRLRGRPLPMDTVATHNHADVQRAVIRICRVGSRAKERSLWIGEC